MIYRRPDTSKPAPGHKIDPYLLRNLALTRPKVPSTAAPAAPSEDGDLAVNQRVAVESRTWV